MNKNKKLILTVLGISLLTNCTPGPTTPDGATLVDEEVALERGAQVDVAQRDIPVDGDSTIVALVDEQLTDVKVKLAVSGASGKTSESFEVENNLRGAGVEIAALDVPRRSRITVTLTGPQNAIAPGRVHLRLRRFDAGSGDATLAAFREWSAATEASLRTDAIRKMGLAAMDRAIVTLESPQGDALLAALARLTKANMLQYFHIDKREWRAEARRAARAFESLARPDALNAARARYIEALALIEMSYDGAAVDPTSTQAMELARASLARLSAPDSAFRGSERAQAISGQALNEINAGNTDDAHRLYAEALAIYHDAGYRAGELEVKCNLAIVQVNLGQFRAAALAFDPLVAEFDKIANPDLRASVYINAARSRAFSSRPDEAVELLHKALVLTREYQLRIQEAAALQGLGNLFINRGDPIQARELYAEVIRISREEGNAMQLNAGLQTGGSVARSEGDYARAIEMHKEAVPLASDPVALMRTKRELGMDYFAAGDYAAAITELREALAVKMQDPLHHAYSDIRRNLAEVLIAHGDGTRATLDEAAKLVAVALERSIAVGDKLGEIGGYRVTGELFAARGKPVEAQAQFERAFSSAHEYRERSASIEARRATLVHEQAAFRGYLDLMLRDVTARGPGQARVASKREERALRMLELARDGNYGAARTGELDAETSARVDTLLAQMGEKSLKIARMLRRDLDATEHAELEALQLDMSNLYAELDRVRMAANARRAGAENYQPNTAREWRALAPGVVQLSYALGTLHAYAWVRSESGIVVTMLAKAPKDLENELIELGALDRQAAPEKVERALEHVSQVLLPKGLLPDTATAVEIVAEGRIAGVPFPGLQSPGDAHRRLVETHAVTMIMSMFAVELPPRPKLARPFQLVALASGHGTLRSAPAMDSAPRLQAATKEIQTVADLFVARDNDAKVKLLLGAEGSAATLRILWTSGADVVHFATHALADLRQPLASLLVLPATGADGAPAYLTAGQVERWRGDAELVFLSACESAIGPPRFAGGMPGLQRAFLRAGARGVIATLWPIEDVLAQEFSADFYRRYTAGQPAAQALGDTQRAWLAPKAGADAAEQTRRRITALAHGFYAP